MLESGSRRVRPGLHGLALTSQSPLPPVAIQFFQLQVSGDQVQDFWNGWKGKQESPKSGEKPLTPVADSWLR